MEQRLQISKIERFAVAEEVSLGESKQKLSSIQCLRKALGIEVESPEQSEDLERRARPEGERPNR
jgi:hypothetical protein